MNIKNLEFENYRNLMLGSISPEKGINIIYGDNAQGKTNILEAIWLFTGGKSFRGSKESELINFDKSKANLKMNFFSEQREQTLQLSIQKRKREGKINGVHKNTMTSFVGKFCAVIFSPNHLSIIKEGPLIRRRLIDAAICQIKPSYIKLLSRYNKNLNERNALIKDMNFNARLANTIDIWNENLGVLGALIVKERMDYVKRLNEHAKSIYSGISTNRESFDLNYSLSFSKENLQNTDDIKDLLIKSLIKNINSDIRVGYTQLGPHKDDLDIRVDGKSTRSFASQGQQRSCVLAIKIAEAYIKENLSKEKPVILLDDVLSELDTVRQNYVINSLGEFQVFITCCDKTAVTKLSDGKVMSVTSGKISS